MFILGFEKRHQHGMRRVKILVLMCADDTSVPRIQPYKSSPKGYLDNTRYGAISRGPHTPNIVLR